MTPPNSSGPQSSIPPHRHPTNWRFSTLLQQIREKRGFTLKEAAQCLPGISLDRYQRWESGSWTPLGAIQTLVIWRLNTAPRPEDSTTLPKPRGSVLIPGVPAMIFMVAAGLVTTHQIRGGRSVAPTIQACIALSASRTLGYQVNAEVYEDYAGKLAATLTQYSTEQWERIFEDLTPIVDAALAQVN